MDDYMSRLLRKTILEGFQVEARVASRLEMGL